MSAFLYTPLRTENYAHIPLHAAGTLPDSGHNWKFYI